MTMYLISYDLKSVQADYEAMYSTINSLGPAQRLLESTWVLAPAKPIDEDAISDRIRSVINQGDRFIVVRIDRHRQGWLARDMWTWMREHEELNLGNRLGDKQEGGD